MSVTDRECTNDECDRVETRFGSEFNFCPFCGEELVIDSVDEDDTDA